MRMILAVVLAALAAPAMAQQPVTLPGGASAVTETHGDWTVRCQVRQPEDKIGCVVQQEQVDNQSRQRLLAVELVPGASGVTGTLILPFGLDLDKGVSLGVDDAQQTPGYRFRTCLPQGCLVPVGFGPDQVPLLTGGKVLHAAAIADGGAATPFTISLNGLASALARAQELAK